MFDSTLLKIFVISALALLGCGSESSTARASDPQGKEVVASAPNEIDSAKSYFEIEGDEHAAANPRVSVHLDRGTGEGMFNDGITRYEIRMLPKPLDKDTLTVWITNLRHDAAPGRIELTDKLAGPGLMVGVGRGLLKGYKKLLSGHLQLEELGDRITLTFEAEVESKSALDKQRAGQKVRVRGRVVGAKIPE